MFPSSKQKPVLPLLSKAEALHRQVMNLSTYYWSNITTIPIVFILYPNSINCILNRHIDVVSVQNARSLALSLVGTLQQDYVQWQQQQQQQFVTTHYTISQPW